LSQTWFPGDLDRKEENMVRLGNGCFDPKTLAIVESAFDEAWITLKTNGNSNIRANELARRILQLAMEGERDPTRLHDEALSGLMPATMWRAVS
jgi:hypothetical protein